MSCVGRQTISLASDFKRNPVLDPFHRLSPRRGSVPKRFDEAFTAFLASEKMHARFFIERATQSSTPVLDKGDDCLFETRCRAGSRPVIAFDMELLAMLG